MRPSPKVKGILVSDRGRQFGFWAMEQRQICWAHLVRKFSAFAERKGAAGQLGQSLLFCAQTVLHMWHQVRDGTMSRAKFQQLVANMRVVV
jgi:transposase